jgi:osmotically-inducible protein OsmY
MKPVMVVLAVLLLTYPAVVPAQTQGTSRQTPQDERPADRGPGFMASAGRAMVDAWITSKAKTRLIASRRITRAVHVETQAGVVTLRGKVASREEKQVAEQVVRDTGGVRAVRSALQIVPDAQRKRVDARDKDIKKSVTARIEQDALLKDADIAVRSDNGVITLTGSVPSPRASTRASALARATSGVQAVRNELKVPVARAAR